MIVTIIGCGPGPDDLSSAGARAIAEADLVVGSPRLVESLTDPDQQTIAATRPNEVVAVIEADGVDGFDRLNSGAPGIPLCGVLGWNRPNAHAKRIAVLMSGEVGFHSGAAKVYARLRAAHPNWEVRLIPGVSAVAALAARVGVPWADACLVSCHGNETDLVAPVRRNRLAFALTGGNVAALGGALTDAGFGALTAWVGEDLGQPTESVTRTTVAGLLERSWSPLTTLLIDNPNFDDRVLSGLPDAGFERDSNATKRVPMTKSSVRALALARLAVRPTDVCYDIGCGTGSVTVELALTAYAGQVWAIDKNPDALALTRQNCRRFHVGNVTVTEGLAPAAIADWPPPDVAFIGGTSGSMHEVVAAIVRRNPHARIAITAIAIESAAAAIDALTTVGINPQITQISVAEGRPVGGLHLLMAQNPVTLITGGCDG